MLLKQSEKQLIEQTLREAKGNKTQAAERLGMSREGLRKKLKRLGIE
jgi:DNA-binding NtrC family response regulator